MFYNYLVYLYTKNLNLHAIFNRKHAVSSLNKIHQFKDNPKILIQIYIDRQTKILSNFKLLKN